MRRDQFTFYRSFFTALTHIRKKSARADAYDAICNYALNGVLPDVDKLDASVVIAVELILPVLKTARKKAGAKVKQREEDFRVSSSQKKEDGRASSARWEENIPANGRKKKEKEAEKELEIEIEKENECSAREEGFDRFWENYPKKVGKQAAKKVFLETEVSLNTLLAAIREQRQSAQWQKAGGQFIPNPVTWLSQRRWEDKLSPVGGVPKGASGVLGKAELENIQRMLKESG